jgi:cellulose synthase/poly-beta-1,6-N-acetylglucosamine synthase-like glycosyltransferase
LGGVNTIIISFLLLLSLRQFLYLFFSVCEEIRREQIPNDFAMHPVSIIVPAYNEGVVIKDTIKTLLSMNYPAFEIIVVDDGSTDKTFDLAREVVDPRLRVFRKDNSGKALSLNYGISFAKYDYVFCMDADSLVGENAIKFGIRHFFDPDVAAVAGSVLVLNQKNAITSFQTVEYLTGLNFFKAAQSYLGLVTIIPGPSGLFKKSAIQAIGGYESDTFAEDCDLTLRLVQSGSKIVYEPYKEVSTEVPEQTLPLIKQRYRWNRGILQATRKYMSQHSLFKVKEAKTLMVFLYLWLESIALPFVNVAIALLSLGYQIFNADFSLLSLWLVVLLGLDLAVLLITLVDSRWPMRLIWYSFFNRFTYSFFQDLVKIISSVEEIVGIRMNWGKLDRVGVNKK